MYGQNLFQPDSKRFITVTEGEYDAISVYQETGYPAVSLRNGGTAKSVLKDIKNNIKWLSEWKYVVLFLDQDEVGQAAVNEIKYQFKPGTVRVVSTDLKDANEFLLQDRGGEIKHLLWQSVVVKPEGLSKPSEILEDYKKEDTYGPSTPWKVINKQMLGLKPKRLSLWAAAEGIGKSTLAMNMVSHLIYNEDVKCAVFSFEEDPVDIIKQLATMNLKTDYIVEHDVPDIPEDYLQKIEDKLLIEKNVEVLKPDDLENTIRHAAIAENCKVFIIDNLTQLEDHLDSKHIHQEMTASMIVTGKHFYILFY